MLEDTFNQAMKKYDQNQIQLIEKWCSLETPKSKTSFLNELSPIKRRQLWANLSMGDQKRLWFALSRQGKIDFFSILKESGVLSLWDILDTDSRFTLWCILGDQERENLLENPQIMDHPFSSFRDFFRSLNETQKVNFTNDILVLG